MRRTIVSSWCTRPKRQVGRKTIRPPSTIHHGKARTAWWQKRLALDLALNNFPHEDRPYNTAILPAPGGDLYVYIYPAQTKNNIWPLGGDVRFTISADGKQIIETRRMHKAILDMEFDPARNPVAGTHSHVLSDVPEDTDVFYVLNRRPLIPEYIVAGNHIFVVNTDGSIQVEKK